MVLSKGKKLILLAVAVVVAIIIIFAVYSISSSNSEKQDAIDRVVDSLLDESSAYSDANPYDEGEISTFITDYWNPMKDDASFQEELVNRLNSEILEPTLQNKESDSSQQVENQYGYAPVPSDTGRILCKLTSFLNQVEYEDAALREKILNYYVQLVGMGVTSIENIEESTDPADKLQLSSELMDILSYIDEYNQSTGTFYQIQESEVISENDKDTVSEFYNQIVQQSSDTGNARVFSEAVSQLTQSSFFENQTVISNDKMIDFLVVDDSSSISTLRQGIGGYYDEISEEPQWDYDGNSYGGGNATFCGDFYYAVYESSGNQYDMSEMTPEVWAALTPGQRAEIEEGNRKTREITVYLKGVEVSSTYKDVIPELDESGFEFAYCNSDGSTLFLSENAVRYFPDAVNQGSYFIRGDFSKQVDEAEMQYSSQGSDITTAVSAVAQGDYEAATKAFMSFSDNGTNLAQICQFALKLRDNDVLDAGLVVIYENINLTDEDMLQFETYIENLY